MNNYQFCAQWVLDQNYEKDIRVLDYGCGTGKIVQELKNQGFNAFGCDLFYAGGDRSKLVEPALFSDGTIRKMNNNIIPFEDEFFDVVINNQVMEHVENLSAVLTEIQRALKPGGVVLNLFPDKEVWREGHCGIPFLHWFPKNSHFRVYYAAVCRSLGLGYHKNNKSIMQWSRDFCEWLDKWTHYRTRQEIDSTYEKYFCDIHHIEDYWFRLRVGEKNFVVNWLAAPVQKVAVVKLCGLVFVARKPT